MIDYLRYTAPVDGPDRVLLIMLPGAGDAAAAFAGNGMLAALHARGQPVDVVAAQPALSLYLEDDLAAALHRLIVAPAVDAGYRRIWLLGISMGGMGALLYADAYGELVEGLILLAPFLGTKGTVAELAKAGGLAAWTAAGSAAVAMERRALLWLQAYLAAERMRPRLHLGYGTGDRFSAGHKLLADALPAACVVTADGGHDWPTWLALWQAVLDRAPFAAAPLTAAG